MYNADCKHAGSLLRDHPLQPSISGIPLVFPFSSSLVVELDIPWDDAQAEVYGQHFKAWDEAQFDAALAAIKDGCPFSSLAYVVTISVDSISLFRCIIPMHSGSLCSAC